MLVTRRHCYGVVTLLTLQLASHGQSGSWAVLRQVDEKRPTRRTEPTRARSRLGHLPLTIAEIPPDGQIGTNHVLEFQPGIHGGNGLNIGAGANSIFLQNGYGISIGYGVESMALCIDSTGAVGTYLQGVDCLTSLLAAQPVTKGQRQQIEQLQQRLSQLEAVVTQLTQAAAQK
jgi:hypothetical protein